MPPRDKPLPRPVPVPAIVSTASTDTDDDDEFEGIVTHWSDDDLLLYQTFRAYLKGISTDDKGELTMRLGIVSEDKPQAFMLTNFTGLVFTFDAYFRPRRRRDTTPDDEIEDEDDR